MNRLLTLLYGITAYAVFLGTFLYAIGFVSNGVVPKTIDSGGDRFSTTALLVDAALLGVFALQHSIMARPWFKARWTKIVPHPIERSTYVLLASLALILLFWQWRPMVNPIWDLGGRSIGLVLTIVSLIGWLVVLIATFMIDHFELFGLRQVWQFWRGAPPSDKGFRTPGLYKLVRHPIMLGFLIAFWSTPTMSAGHLLFAVATSAYILVGIKLEERDLSILFGDAYRNYRASISMVVPLPRRR